MQKENIQFWNRLEEDLSIKIPCYVKNVFSMSGFRDAVTLKTLTKDDIETVEQFAKTKLHKRIEELNSTTDSVEIDPIHFFGVLYSTSPSSFEFNSGDIRLLLELSSHIKRVVDKGGTNNNIHHFSSASASSSKKKRNNFNGCTYSNLFSGWYFSADEKKMTCFSNLDTAESTEQISNRADVGNSASRNLCDLKLKLLAGMKKTIKPFLSSDDFILLHEDMVTVNFVDNDVKGSVMCFSCSKSKSNASMVNVYLKKTVANGQLSFYWVMSNFSKHLKSHKSKESEAVLDENSADASNDTILVITEPVTDEDCGDTSNDTILVITEGSAEENDSSKNTEVEEIQSGNTTLELEIHPVDRGLTPEQIENEIYAQISGQIVEMMQATLLNGNTMSEIPCFFHNKMRNVQIVKIKGDGACLFRTLAHQLNRDSNKTKSHDLSVKKLRSDVISYITSHLDKFKHDLKGRIFESKTESEVEQIMDMDQECMDFVKNVLGKPGGWGGSETIRAVSIIHQVNILIINEGENCYYAHDFNPDFKRTIFAVYRLAGNINLIEQRNHYDSLVGMSPDDIYDLVKVLASREIESTLEQYTR